MKLPRGAGLVTLFAALLAGCSDRALPGEEAGGTEGGTDSGTSEAAPNTTTSGPTSTSTGSEPVTTSASSVTFTTDEVPMCVYATHDIVLTPEEYDAWLHGMGMGSGDTEGGSTTAADPGTTGGGGTAGDTTAGDTTSAGGTTGGTTAADTTGTDTDATTGAEPWSFELCVKICDALTAASPWDITSCDQVGLDAEGNILIECVQIIEHCDGRSHACIASRGAVTLADPVIAHLARAAHDEAASVHAFAALADELAALGAPRELLARIQAATADEVRHAEAVARLVADRGGRCRPPAHRPHAARQAREIAIENAVEGCVRETWAALLAAHQARHAADPRVRAVMKSIAADEARHAELAWAIDAWLWGLLDPAARAEVESARRAAAAAVVLGVTAREPAPALVHEAGLPGRAPATHLVLGLAATLWAA